MVTIGIEILGEKRFIRAFSRIQDVRDLSPAYNLLYEDFKEIEKEIFDREGSSRKFKPLTPKYAAWKMKRFPGRKIMVLTGALRGAMVGGGPGSVKVVRPKRAVFGVDENAIPYARRHQRTGRRIIQMTEPRKRRWGRIIHQWALDTVKEEIEIARRTVER